MSMFMCAIHGRLEDCDYVGCEAAPALGEFDMICDDAVPDYVERLETERDAIMVAMAHGEGNYRLDTRLALLNSEIRRLA